MLRSLSYAGTYLASILILVAAFGCLLYIHRYGVDVVTQDMLMMAPRIDHLYTGRLEFRDLFDQFGEHRLFFPLAIMFVVGPLTGFNDYALMTCTWIVLCAITLVLYLQLRVQSPDLTNNHRLLAFLPIVYLVFSLRQAESLLFGFLIQSYLVILATVLSFYLLDGVSGVGRRFLCAIAAAVLATFSFGSGLLVWPLGLLSILLAQRRSGGPGPVVRAHLALIWSVAAGVAAKLYFTDYAISPSGFDLVLAHPNDAALFVLIMLGGPLTPDKFTAAWIGLGLLVAYTGTVLFTLRSTRTTRGVSLVPCLLIMFTVGSTLLAVTNRLVLGIDQSITSRYTTPGTLGIIGLCLAMMTSSYFPVRLLTTLRPVVVVLVTCGLVVSALWGLQAGRDTHYVTKLQAHILLTYRVQSDSTLRGIAPFAEVVGQVPRDLARIMEQHGLTVFRYPRVDPDQLALLGRANAFSLATISLNGWTLNTLDSNRAFVMRPDDTVTLVGTAGDSTAASPASMIFVTIDDSLHIPADYPVDRVYLHEYVKSGVLDGSYPDTAFRALFSGRALTSGLHVLTFRVLTADGSGYLVPDEKIILEVE